MTEFFDFDGEIIDWMRFPEEPDDGAYDDRCQYEEVKRSLLKATAVYTNEEREAMLAKMEAAREKYRRE